MHQIEITHTKGGAKSASKCASAPSGFGVNRVAQSFRKESVTAERAMRNTHMHQQVGAKKWAIQDSNLNREKPASDIENKENDNTHTQGGAKCAPLQDKSEQFAQLLQAFQALTPDERNALLKALGGGG